MGVHWLKILLIGLFSMVWIHSYADDVEIQPTQHPIDAWYEDSLSGEKVSSDTEMRNITNQARIKWESELKVVYNRVLKRLNPTQQSTLRKSQQQWFKYRTAEVKLIDEIVSSRQVTIHQLYGAKYEMQIVRSRVMDLLSYEQEFDK